MQTYNLLQENIGDIEKKLMVSFNNKELLIMAFVHRSYFNENKGVAVGYNERLEFLGDSVLNLIVSHILFEKLPELSEGGLSHLKSSLIDADSCSKFLKILNLENHILLGIGEEKTKDRGRERILSDCFEAIIGAIYLDQGLIAAKNFFIRHFEQELLQIIKTPQINYKAVMQDFAQRTYQTQPVYRLLEETGVDHLKTFKIAVMINDEQLGIGVGSSKKIAEQKAAENAMKKIIE